MRKVFTVLGILALGAALGRLFDGAPPRAEAGQEPECAPLLVTGDGEVIQDMNGDGVLDPITEAVRLLSWAFLGAPAPVPPCAGGGASGLPDTGQTQCFTCSGEPCPLPFPVFLAFLTSQDGRQVTGCPNDASRFTDNGDGTVTDHCTGLMWQKDTGNDGNRLDWCDALTYCFDLNFAGHDDWRLPNVRELQSIVDYGRSFPAIDPVFGALSSFYWSSTSIVGNPSLAWDVGFGNGSVSLDGDKGIIISHVRAVRSGP